MTTDYYRVLGIEPDATDAQIKHAFRAAARQLHPDVGSGESARFAAAVEAHRILGDPARRAEYDAYQRGRPRLWPASVDVGVLGVDDIVRRVVVVTNMGQGQPELGLSAVSGTGWRILTVAGSTAPEAGVELTIEIAGQGLPGRHIRQSLVVSMGSTSETLAISFSVRAQGPAAGKWRVQAQTPQPQAVARSHGLPGWDSLERQPRKQLIGAAAIVGAVIPAALISSNHGVSASTATVLVALALALALGVGALAVRTEFFDPDCLATAGPADQAGVLTMYGVGALTTAMVVLAVVIAIVLIAIVFVVLAAVASDS
jgi:hypothetical protein